MKSLIRIFCSSIVIIFYISDCVNAQVRLPRLISDGIVLQRDTDVKIWGWAEKNEQISVSFLDTIYNIAAGNNGEWALVISDMKAGGPYEMQISASNLITVKDIMVGDVWVCSGQSNMELNMKRASPLYKDEITNCRNDYIRQFIVPKTYNFIEPQKDISSGMWKAVDPETILEFSAVAYFFAAELYERYKVPIGLINASLGGTPAEAWMSSEALKEFPVHFMEAQKLKDGTIINKTIAQDNERIKSWYDLLRKKDEGYKDRNNDWHNPNLNTSDWAIMKIPGYWAETQLGPVNGVVWFRKEISVPASMAGKQAKLFLGRIVDADSVYVNGVFIGTTGYQYPPRRYEIPADVLTEGKNLITVRVISNIGRGGFVNDKPYELVTEEETIDIKGDWQYRLGATMEPLAGQTFFTYKPGGLYNAMIAPILNMGIKGVIWYQGESNAGKSEEYARLFPALIYDWRKNWSQGDFPILYVQLPNFMEVQSQPGESDWALCRESQLKTLSVPNTAMAVAIDLGEWNDIHPLNKKDVGKRLALSAKALAYGEDIVYSGPLFQSFEVKGSKVMLTFNNTGSGLDGKGNKKLKSFAIAGSDRKFVWAEAKIKGRKVIVRSKDVAHPVAVRYAWANNPTDAKLYNKEGLPASPFRTDNWATY